MVKIFSLNDKDKQKLADLFDINDSTYDKVRTEFVEAVKDPKTEIMKIKVDGKPSNILKLHIGKMSREGKKLAPIIHRDPEVMQFIDKLSDDLQLKETITITDVDGKQIINTEIDDTQIGFIDKKGIVPPFKMVCKDPYRLIEEKMNERVFEKEEELKQQTKRLKKLKSVDKKKEVNRRITDLKLEIQDIRKDNKSIIDEESNRLNKEIAELKKHKINAFGNEKDEINSKLQLLRKDRDCFRIIKDDFKGKNERNKVMAYFVRTHSRNEPFMLFNLKTQPKNEFCTDLDLDIRKKTTIVAEYKNKLENEIGTLEELRNNANKKEQEEIVGLMKEKTKIRREVSLLRQQLKDKERSDWSQLKMKFDMLQANIKNLTTEVTTRSQILGEKERDETWKERNKQLIQMKEKIISLEKYILTQTIRKKNTCAYTKYKIEKLPNDYAKKLKSMGLEDELDKRLIYLEKSLSDLEELKLTDPDKYERRIKKRKYGLAKKREQYGVGDTPTDKIMSAKSIIEGRFEDNDGNIPIGQWYNFSKKTLTFDTVDDLYRAMGTLLANNEREFRKKRNELNEELKDTYDKDKIAELQEELLNLEQEHDNPFIIGEPIEEKKAFIKLEQESGNKIPDDIDKNSDVLGYSTDSDRNAKFMKYVLSGKRKKNDDSISIDLDEFTKLLLSGTYSSRLDRRLGRKYIVNGMLSDLGVDKGSNNFKQNTPDQLFSDAFDQKSLSQLDKDIEGISAKVRINDGFDMKLYRELERLKKTSRKVSLLNEEISENESVINTMKDTIKKNRADLKSNLSNDEKNKLKQQNKEYTKKIKQINTENKKLLKLRNNEQSKKLEDWSKSKQIRKEKTEDEGLAQHMKRQYKEGTIETVENEEKIELNKFGKRKKMKGNRLPTKSEVQEAIGRKKKNTYY